MTTAMTHRSLRATALTICALATVHAGKSFPALAELPAGLSRFRK